MKTVTTHMTQCEGRQWWKKTIKKHENNPIYLTLITYLENWDISEPSEVGSYILNKRPTICSSNFFAKILSNPLERLCIYCVIVDLSSSSLIFAQHQNNNNNNNNSSTNDKNNLTFNTNLSGVHRIILILKIRFHKSYKLYSRLE